MNRKHTLTLLAALALTACGGGGSSDTPEQPAPVVVTPGMYLGTTNTGGDFVGLAIENGDLWALYVVGDTGGMIQGNASDGWRDYGYVPSQPVAVNFTSASSTSLAGNVRDSSAQANIVASFSGSKPAGYEYNRPVVVSTISGRWSGIPASTGENLTIDITAGGAVSGLSSGGCRFTGVVAPHGSKNLYDVNITFGAAPCELANQSARGVAIGDAQSLIVLLVDSSRQYGLGAVGTR